MVLWEVEAIAKEKWGLLTNLRALAVLIAAKRDATANPPSEPSFHKVGHAGPGDDGEQSAVSAV